MPPWHVRPIIYEVNTWAWLSDISQRYQRSINLNTIPAEEWDRLAENGFDAVWLMGIWQRSPASLQVSSHNPSQIAEFQSALPDFCPEDNIGSAYSVRGYTVDQRLGGSQGLLSARQALAQRGMRLILDYVPNHVSLDHPWVSEHPEYFIQGGDEDMHKYPGVYHSTGTHLLAFGRDPYFPPWADTLQLNAFHPGLRQAVTDTINEIASQCDGLRCDMAMLLLNRIFYNTWADRAGMIPDLEFWAEVIDRAKAHYPELLFIAEAYWGTEAELLSLGFDYCYDKLLYDFLEKEDTPSLHNHLSLDPAYQERLIRFIENHDERRAVVNFPAQKLKCAALVSSTLPGAKMFHEGQLDGRQVRLPVFLRRRPIETPDLKLYIFYTRLLQILHTPCLREGEWKLMSVHSGQGESTHSSILAWSWYKDDEYYLVAANISAQPAQGYLQVDWEQGTGHIWQLRDVFDQDVSQLSHNLSSIYLQGNRLSFNLLPWEARLVQLFADLVR